MSRITSNSLAVAREGTTIMLGGYGASQAIAAPRSTSAHVSLSSAHVSLSQTLATTISIRHFTFRVLSTVAPGHTVKVVNHQGTFHSVSRNRRRFQRDCPATLDTHLPGPARNGDYKFHCKFHSDMHGRLRVR